MSIPTNFSSQTGQRKRRGAIPAAEVQNAQRRRYPERVYERFSRFAHEGGNLGKVTLFPQRFVWIRDSVPRLLWEPFDAPFLILLDWYCQSSLQEKFFLRKSMALTSAATASITSTTGSTLNSKTAKKLVK